MTDIDTMPAGRELDALAAQAMGLVIIETDECNGIDNLWLEPYRYHWDDRALPRYSTDLAAAWTLDKPGWLWRFDEYEDFLDVNVISLSMYVCAIAVWSETSNKATAYALARTRAAVKAALAQQHQEGVT